MAFAIEISNAALQDAEEQVEYIRTTQRQPEAAERWWRGLLRAIFSLEDRPERCPLISEAGSFDFEVRHLLYYSHRIIFRITYDRAAVVILRVYHGRRRVLKPADAAETSDIETRSIQQAKKGLWARGTCRVTLSAVFDRLKR